MAAEQHRPPSGRVPTAGVQQTAELARLRAELPGTLAELFAWRVGATPERLALRWPRADGEWTGLTWRQAADRVEEIAAGLLTLGLRPQERVAIASSTRVEWVLTAIAIMRAAGSVTTLYPLSDPEDVRFILDDSSAVIAIVEDGDQLARVRDHWTGLAALRAMVVLDPRALGPDSEHAGDRRVLTMDQLCERGRALLAADADSVARSSAAIAPDDLATVMYTSGTTGRPHGVWAPHSAWVHQGMATAALGLMTERDVDYLCLPMAHPMGLAALSAQLTIGFTSAVSADLKQLARHLSVVRPTVLTCGPRSFESMVSRMRLELQDDSPSRARIAGWALRVGEQVAQRHEQGRAVGLSLSVQHRVAGLVLLSRLRKRLGGRLRFVLSGAAVLDPALVRWFQAVGTTVLEGYFLTEACGMAFLSRPGRSVPSTVGWPLPGTDVTLARDGEIMVRGPGVVADGWFATGDAGRFVDGSLHIVGRMADLVVLRDGTVVAPQRIESRIMAVCPYAAAAVVHVDRYAGVVALICLDADAMAGWAQRYAMAGAPYRQVVGSGEVREMVQQYVDEVNRALPAAQRIRAFAILDRPLSVEQGELTPARRVRRDVVEHRHRAILDQLYAG